jgi:hypothetical protein
MEYNEAKSKIKSGDLLAWTHRKSMFASWYDFKAGAVRLFTRSEYTHVGMAWVVAGRHFVIEAVTPCVRIYPLSRSGDFYWLALEANWTSEVEEVALSKVGYPYSMVSAIQSLFQELDAEDVSECAALVKYVLKVAGIDLGKRSTPDAIVYEAQQRESVETVFVKNK